LSFLQEDDLKQVSAGLTSIAVAWAWSIAANRRHSVLRGAKKPAQPLRSTWSKVLDPTHPPEPSNRITFSKHGPNRQRQDVPTLAKARTKEEIQGGRLVSMLCSFVGSAEQAFQYKGPLIFSVRPKRQRWPLKEAVGRPHQILLLWDTTTWFLRSVRFSVELFVDYFFLVSVTF
jgi:hypothetical protein